MNLVRLLLQRFERGADLLVPVATRVLDLLPEMVVSHVHIRVVAGPLDVRHVQSNLSFYVLHRLLDACRELLRAKHAYTSRKMNIGLLVHGQVTIIFVVSVCLSVCLFVQSFSQPSLIRFRSN